MSDRTKEILSMVAAFIAGFGPAYYANPAASAWLGWVVAGLVSFGVWVGGYSQTNPRNQPRTAEALLEAVKRTELPSAAKTATAQALGTVVVKEATAITSTQEKKET